MVSLSTIVWWTNYMRSLGLSSINLPCIMCQPMVLLKLSIRHFVTCWKKWWNTRKEIGTRESEKRYRHIEQHTKHPYKLPHIRWCIALKQSFLCSDKFSLFELLYKKGLQIRRMPDWDWRNLRHLMKKGWKLNKTSNFTKCYYLELLTRRSSLDHSNKEI